MTIAIETLKDEAADPAPPATEEPQGGEQALLGSLRTRAKLLKGIPVSDEIVALLAAYDASRSQVARLEAELREARQNFESVRGSFQSASETILQREEAIRCLTQERNAARQERDEARGELKAIDRALWPNLEFKRESRAGCITRLFTALNDARLTHLRAHPLAQPAPVEPGRMAQLAELAKRWEQAQEAANTYASARWDSDGVPRCATTAQDEAEMERLQAASELAQTAYLEAEKAIPGSGSISELILLSLAEGRAQPAEPDACGDGKRYRLCTDADGHFVEDEREQVVGYFAFDLSGEGDYREWNRAQLGRAKLFLRALTQEDQGTSLAAEVERLRGIIFEAVRARHAHEIKKMLFETARGEYHIAETWDQEARRTLSRAVDEHEQPGFVLGVGVPEPEGAVS
jgi:hypothetical protein